ncbi:hypothetical protein BLSTO_01284 [Blastocystis sp. subtype 1]
MSKAGSQQSETGVQLLLYWKSRLNSFSRDSFLPNVASALGRSPVQLLYDEMSSIVMKIHINNLVIQDVNKLTLAIFNSVLAALMDDVIIGGNKERALALLTNQSMTHSVLALSYDTSIYLLINNQFDILSRLSAFGVTTFDILRILEKFVQKLNQQSYYLIAGDVRNHYTRINENIVNYAIWCSDSTIWQSIGVKNETRVTVSVELLIRNLLYFANMHIRELSAVLDIPAPKKELAWKLLRHIVQCSVFLLRDRTVDCLLVCSLYSIAKLFKVDLGFVKLLNAFASLFPDTLHRVKYNIVMGCEELGIRPEKQRGNIIDFYNNVFVLANNDYLGTFTARIEEKGDGCSLQAAATEKRCLSIQESIKEEAKETLACLQQTVEKAPVPAASSGVMTPTNSVKGREEPRAAVPEVLTATGAAPPAEKTVSGSVSGAMKSILLDDPKSLHNTEEEVKDVLMNLASLSPSRNAPLLSRGSSRSLPHFAQSPTGTPEATPAQMTNIVLEYKYGRPTGSVAKRPVEVGYITSPIPQSERMDPVEEKRRKTE